MVYTWLEMLIVFPCASPFRPLLTKYTELFRTKNSTPLTFCLWYLCHLTLKSPGKYRKQSCITNGSRCRASKKHAAWPQETQANFDGQNNIVYSHIIGSLQAPPWRINERIYTTSFQEIQPVPPSWTLCRSDLMTLACSRGACDPCFVHSSQIHAGTS